MDGHAGAAGILGTRLERRFVWLDAMAYARRLFDPKEKLWSNTPRYVDVVRQGQRLLGSDVIEIGLDAFFQADASAANVATPRPLVGLRRLIGDDVPLRRAAECVRALRSLFGNVPIFVVVGGAAKWLSLAAGAEPGRVFTSDDLDKASVSLAGLVRSFGTSGISGIAIDVRGEGCPEAVNRVSLHDPIFNVARHYGWTIALVTDVAPAASEAISVDVVLRRDLHVGELGEPDVTPVIGGGLTTEFWLEESTPPLPSSGLFYGEIPEDAEPERVLAKLASLRS